MDVKKDSYRDLSFYSLIHISMPTNKFDSHFWKFLGDLETAFNDVFTKKFFQIIEWRFSDDKEKMCHKIMQVFVQKYPQGEILYVPQIKYSH